MRASDNEGLDDIMDVQRLLGQFLGAEGQHGSPSRDGGRSGTGADGNLVDQLGGMLSGRGGSAMGGALAGGLASHLFRGKRKRKMGGSALKLGGAAIVAGLAYKAYQSYQAKNTGSGAPAGNAPTAPRGEIPSPEGTEFLPHGQEDAHASLMLSSMIAAAKADGYIDAQEEQAIFGRIDELDLDAEEKGYLMDEMRHPVSAAELAARATTREMKIEVYTAAVMAIDADHPAEKDYLDRLARQLGIPEKLASEIRSTTDDVQE